MYKIFLFCELHKITPNMLYTLHCISEGKEPGVMNLHTELRLLKNSRFLKTDGLISEKGLKALEEGLEILSSAGTIEEVARDYVDEYRSLFPAITLPSGKPARVNPKTLESAFKWFFKTYDYSWDTIFKATEHYLDQYEEKKYLYMRNSQYFIVKTLPDKSRESELANYCDIIENGQEQKKKDFKTKVV